MTSDLPLDYLDYTSLRFPSDAVTLLAIRRAHPARFDVEGGPRFRDDGADEFRLNALCYLERLVARAAYEAALGKATDLYADRGLDRETCVAELTDLYARYGVAAGEQHTRQLIRDLEAQAAAQAAGPQRGV